LRRGVAYDSAATESFTSFMFLPLHHYAREYEPP
jgi:hypothetical protein